MKTNPQGDSALAIRTEVLTFPQTGVNVFERAKEDPSGIFLQDDFFSLIFKIPHLKQELFIRGLKNSIEGKEFALHMSNLSLIPSILDGPLSPPGVSTEQGVTSECYWM